MGTKNSLKAKTSAELLSYIINVTPELRDNIDLPVQGESIAPIGKIIMNNERYRNAFINTVNLIGLTVIKRNGWDNPWEFTKRGTLRFGQQIREIINDLCNVYDYNENFSDKDRFLSTVVPNVLNYMHEVNFQKFYQTTTSDAQLAMAFETEDLFTYIDDAISMLFESLKYDTYIVDKYMLCKRIVDGTVTSYKISNFATKTTREIVAEMKGISNKMTFRSPNYNPAGIRKATRFEDQITIVNTDFDGKITTEVLATSYFRNDAEMKTQLALIDGFAEHDTGRLAELLGDAYVPFTDAELTALAKVPAVILAREWFMDYDYAMNTESGEKTTEFYNPTTLENNHFLHAWKVFSTSPFENACVFEQDDITVTSVSVSPSSANITKGQNLKLSASVETTGFANKGVLWDINSVAKTAGAEINQSGELKVPSDYVSAGSGTPGVFDIEISTILESGDKIIVNGCTYTVDASSEDTIAKQITALKSALNDAKVTDYFSIGGSSPHCTLTQKSGYYGQAVPVFEFVAGSGSDGEADITETTAGVIPNNTIIVSASSVYDNTKVGTSKVTVS